MRYIIYLMLCVSYAIAIDRIDMSVISSFSTKDDNNNKASIDYNFPNNTDSNNANTIPLSTKDEYLYKFYKVWNLELSDIESKEAVFYILPSMNAAIESAQKLELLKQNPPKKNAKNYKAALAKYNKDISELDKKIKTILGVGENLLPNSIDEFRSIIDNMNVDSYMKHPRIAIITKATSVRVVPTNKPRYKNKEDFPFDRWQNSFVFEGTPVLITNFSKDSRFAHVRTPFVYGFVDSRNLAFVDDSLRRQILSFNDYKIPNEDFVPLRFKESFILDARIGQIFPYDRRMHKLITYYKDSNNFAKIREVDFDNAKFSDFPMPFSNKNMSLLIDSMQGQKYGWGGIFGNRDCSAFTRDSFANFGIFLPRNSAAQAKFGGRFVDLSKESDATKEAYIIEHGIPYASIIWLKGHIMLYVGYEESNGKKRALVAHSAWSFNPIVNKKREKVNLGGVSITTLHVDTDAFGNDNVQNTMLSRIRGITNIYDTDSYSIRD